MAKCGKTKRVYTPKPTNQELYNKIDAALRTELAEALPELVGQPLHAMLDRGVYLAPSAFEAGFLSTAHSEQDIADTIEAARAAFKLVAG